MKNFEVVGRIANIEVVASGSGVRLRRHLNKAYGRGRWRKLKGVATIRIPNGVFRVVELHWYEAHGIGRRDLKIKCYLEET
ncbi:hypothetical protein HY522_08805 [bacterium]|nr:hypothetical protein [bacterium]